MILRELFYYDKETLEPVEDNRYEPLSDDSIVDIDDTRKTRLTLNPTQSSKESKRATYKRKARRT